MDWDGKTCDAKELKDDLLEDPLFAREKKHRKIF